MIVDETKSFCTMSSKTGFFRVRQIQIIRYAHIDILDTLMVPVETARTCREWRVTIPYVVPRYVPKGEFCFFTLGMLRTKK